MKTIELSQLNDNQAGKTMVHFSGICCLVRTTGSIPRNTGFRVRYFSRIPGASYQGILIKRCFISSIVFPPYSKLAYHGQNLF
jgi:hypothetical protein